MDPIDLQKDPPTLADIDAARARINDEVSNRIERENIRRMNSQKKRAWAHTHVFLAFVILALLGIFVGNTDRIGAAILITFAGVALLLSSVHHWIYRRGQGDLAESELEELRPAILSDYSGPLWGATWDQLASISTVPGLASQTAAAVREDAAARAYAARVASMGRDLTVAEANMIISQAATAANTEGDDERAMSELRSLAPGV